MMGDFGVLKFRLHLYFAHACGSQLPANLVRARNHCRSWELRWVD